MTKMRVVVTGASGLVGRALTRRFAAPSIESPRPAERGEGGRRPGEGSEVFRLTHADLDITDRDAVRRKMAQLRPDLIINCAVVGVDACEDDPKLAKAVNVDGPRNLAEVAQTIVHFSSNYVFEGAVEKLYDIGDETKPVNEYGRTKLAGERAVAAACRNTIIIRSSWIFGPGKESFISTVHRELRAGKSVRAVSDIWASTTFVDDLVLRVVEIVDRREYGLHHVVNAGVCSNATFALEAARIVAAPAHLVQSVSTRDTHRAPRPRYTPLRAMPPLRDWREALAAYISADHD
jgi:dTDP-4-dehydrorhamnose reductase